MAEIIEFPRQLRTDDWTFTELYHLKNQASLLMALGAVDEVDSYMTEEGDAVFTYLNPQGEARWTINKISCGHTKRYVAFDKDFMILDEGSEIERLLLSVFSFRPLTEVEKNGS